MSNRCANKTKDVNTWTALNGNRMWKALIERIHADLKTFFVMVVRVNPLESDLISIPLPLIISCTAGKFLQYRKRGGKTSVLMLNAMFL
jgi:hypothetical protein